MNDASKNRKPSILLRFFSSPVVSVTGVVVGILGIGVSIYLFMASREQPDLTYFVHPAKAAVVRSGQTSRLAVQFNGQEQTGDITAAQVAFWNAGSKPISDVEILKPLVIRTGPANPILEVKLRKSSRDIVRFNLDDSRLSDGEIEISWNILEYNDGGIIQIIYAGDDSVDIHASAVVLGQKTIKELPPPERVDPSNLSSEYRDKVKTMYYVIILIFAALGSAVIFISRWRGEPLIATVIEGLIILILPIGWTAWTVVTLPPFGPPFGF